MSIKHLVAGLLAFVVSLALAFAGLLALALVFFPVSKAARPEAVAVVTKSNMTAPAVRQEVKAVQEPRPKQEEPKPTAEGEQPNNSP
jgi:hypothetical protein